MPQYFFDLDENGTSKRDAFGVILESLDEARDQAVAILPDLARDEIPSGETYSYTCTVLDEKRRVVYRGTLVYTGEWLRPDEGISGGLR